MDRDGGVGHQGPRRGRPHQQRRTELGERPAGHREADVDAGVDDVGVALRDLVVGQRGAAPRAVGRHAVVLDEQALVGDPREAPPDALHVGGVHRPVGLRQVDPVAHPLGEPLELVHVPQHALAAPVVEGRHAVRLDVLLAGEAQLLLHGQLHGQAVAVPAGAPRDRAAAHRLEPREEVLEDAGLDVVRAGVAVGGRRPLVEDPRLAARGLLQAALEDPVVAPAGEHVVLERGQVDLGGQGAHAVLRRGVLRRRDEVRARPAVPPSLGPLAVPALAVRAARDLSGLMFAGGLAPGLAPTPARSWLLAPLLVPDPATASA